MLFSVCDCETTGLDDHAQVVEIAIVTFGAEYPPWYWQQLIRPTVPITIGARAVHHITDEQLAAAPTIVRYMESVGELFVLPSVFVAHNAEFDRRMLLQSGIPEHWLPEETICTYRCAKHLYPDAPSFGNQPIRYYLGIQIESEDPRMHRALPDALVTAAILRKMLEVKTGQELIELSKQPALLNTVTFGKNKGKPWSSITDISYLQWVARSDFDKDIVHTARHWVAQRTGAKNGGC